VAKRTYHHGDLRRALLDAAVAAIEESGPAALSLRDLARRAGVSHAAPTHHFGDKAGLLTALAAEGYGLLADELAAEHAASASFLEMGVAYVRFAVAHRAHFEVMFQPELYHADDPELVAARGRSAASLYAGAANLPKGGGTKVREAEVPEDGGSNTREADLRKGGGRTVRKAELREGGGSSARGADLRSGGGQKVREAELPEGGVRNIEEVDLADGSGRNVREAGLAGWSMAHGFATLWLSGSLLDMGDDPATTARTVLRQLGPDA
jgi:AcrR family transcriptional regulator